MASPGARIGVMIAIGSFAVVALLAHRASLELHRFRSEDPAVWEREIAAFERADRREPPAPDSILVVGSSAIRLWESADEDLAPFRVLRRGFGGAKIRDILYYLDRIVVPYAPRAVIVAAGGNDLFARAGSEPKRPEEIVQVCDEIVRALADSLPGTPVYFVALRPPILDAQGRDPFSQTNVLLREIAAQRDGVGWIDANADLYGADGRSRPEFLDADRVHLTREGYRAWAAPIRERLSRELSAGSEEPGREQAERG